MANVQPADLNPGMHLATTTPWRFARTPRQDVRLPTFRPTSHSTQMGSVKLTISWILQFTSAALARLPPLLLTPIGSGFLLSGLPFNKSASITKQNWVLGIASLEEDDAKQWCRSPSRLQRP